MDIQKTLFVGIDVHKYSHTAVIVDCFNREQGSLSFSNSDFDKFLRKTEAIAKNKDLVFGLEDINGNGKLLAEELVRNDFLVVNVPSVMTDRLRRKTTHRNKSDYLDAKGVAKVTLLSHRTLPQKMISREDSVANDMQGLVYDRESIVKTQTRIKNHLHVLLHRRFGDNYKLGKKSSAIFGSKHLVVYLSKLSCKTVLERRIERKIKELENIYLQREEIDSDLKDLAERCKDIEKLKSLRGCGILSACKIVAEIKSIARFGTAEKLVCYAGLAPREASSGSKERRYTDHAGNRNLNKAVHFIALAQIGNRGNFEGKKYYQKKLLEGKSKLHSLRCLKRQIIVRIFRLLSR
jgi:transposase